MAKVQELSTLEAQSASLESIAHAATGRRPWRNRDVGRHMRKTHADVEKGVVHKAIARAGGNESLVPVVFVLAMIGVVASVITSVVSFQPTTLNEYMVAFIMVLVIVVLGTSFAAGISLLAVPVFGLRYEWQEVVLCGIGQPVPHAIGRILVPDFVRDTVSQIWELRPNATFRVSYLADDPVLWVTDGKERVAALVWENDQVIDPPAT